MDDLELKAAEPAGIPADDIDLDFPARLSPAVGTAILDDEAILLDPATGASHLLDGPGTLIVQCLDGVSPLRDIAVDIADGLSLELPTVEADVLGLVQTLGGLGVIDGVRRDDHAGHGHTGHDHSQELPAGLAVGSDLSGWDGFADLAARPLLVVNWGTRCGYCTRIADGLGEALPRLESAGFGLLLVTLGSPEELVDQLAGVSLPVAHVDVIPDFFAGLGTPAAYAVGADRLTTLPIAYGADQVPTLVAQLTDQ